MKEESPHQQTRIVAKKLQELYANPASRRARRRGMEMILKPLLPGGSRMAWHGWGRGEGKYRRVGAGSQDKHDSLRQRNLDPEDPCCPSMFPSPGQFEERKAL